MLTPRTYAEHEKAVIAGAERFVACNFMGRAAFDKKECTTRPEAIAAARSMIANRDPADVYNKGRPILVYAIKGVHQVVSDTVYP